EGRMDVIELSTSKTLFHGKIGEVPLKFLPHDHSTAMDQWWPYKGKLELVFESGVRVVRKQGLWGVRGTDGQWLLHPCCSLKGLFPDRVWLEDHRNNEFGHIYAFQQNGQPLPHLFGFSPMDSPLDSPFFAEHINWTANGSSNSSDKWFIDPLGH